MSTDMSGFVRHMLTDFASRQKGNLDEWNEKAVKYYLDLSQKFADSSYSEGQKIVSTQNQRGDGNISEVEELLRGYAKRRGDVKHALKVQYSVMRLYYYKNLVKRFFNLLRNQTSFKRYKKRMTRFAQNYHKNRLPSRLFFEWKAVTRVSIRQEITEQVNRRTDAEIQKMHREYEQIIAQMEGLLEKKLTELKNEESHHRELQRRYEEITDRGRQF